MSTRFPAPARLAALLAAALCTNLMPAHAGDDVKVLLELLLEKGIITQAEYDAKIRKAQEIEEIRAFNEAQDVRRLAKEAEARAETERKFKTQIYGQVSAGWYQASNMTSSNLDANGMSDQPKGNNRVGLKVTRELDGDVSAMITLESNFSARTGAVGRDAAGYGVANSGATTAAFLDREANVRLISKTYGTAILGRGPTLQNDLSSAFDARDNWNFGGLKPIGRYVGFQSASGVNRSDKMFRYISPAFNGFNLDVAVGFGGVPGNDEIGGSSHIGGRYKNGNFEAGYNHAEVKIATSSTPNSQARVNNRVDFFAAKYKFDKLTLNGGYVQTRNPSLASGGSFDTTRTGGKVSADTWFTGAVYQLTPMLSWNLGYYEVSDKTAQTAQNQNNGLSMWATGVMYAPYKDWTFFADYVTASRQAGATGAFTIYDKWIPDTTNTSGYAESKTSQAGLSVGAQFKF